jgi:energy-coupling factor transporter ATP-binding protein EcfA2
VQYREFYDPAIVECMKLPISLSVAGPSARKIEPAKLLVLAAAATVVLTIVDGLLDMAAMRAAEGASERIGAARVLGGSMSIGILLVVATYLRSLYAPVRGLTKRSVRSRFAYVPQDPWLLDATVAENIAFGNPLATRDDVLEAGRAALVDEFIGRLPHGYDTSLGESGVRLSGGQRRRVAIARAAVSKAPMVLLDEPTASLDPRSAAAVIEAIRTATTNRTVLVVTHDRDLAAIADRVVTLAGPVSPGGPGVHRSTDLQQDGDLQEDGRR